MPPYLQWQPARAAQGLKKPPQKGGFALELVVEKDANLRDT